MDIPKGYRFGLHNLRHSLSTWLANKAKVDPKTVQGMLRHSKIETTMNLYTQDDHENKIDAQGLASSRRAFTDLWVQLWVGLFRAETLQAAEKKW